MKEEKLIKDMKREILVESEFNLIDIELIKKELDNIIFLVE